MSASHDSEDEPVQIIETDEQIDHENTNGLSPNNTLTEENIQNDILSGYEADDDVDKDNVDKDNVDKDNVDKESNANLDLQTEYTDTMKNIDNVENELRKKMGVSDDVSLEDFLKYCMQMMKQNGDVSDSNEQDNEPKKIRRRRTTAQTRQIMRFRKGRPTKSLVEIRQELKSNQNQS